jgi:hypothetical protein
MILIILQILAFAALVAWFVRWRTASRRRNAQTWESLVARLRIDWSARDLSDNFLWKDGLNVTAEDAWTRMDGARGLWAMFQNACVMMEMADYAARNCSDADRVLLATLRSDAMQIRLCVLMSLAQYGFTQASEGVRVNAFRAAEMYTGMAARMTCLLQENAATVLPDFVAAM